ncbi:hypothetical protein RFI_39063, partial [Reticulomyxa filosa]
MKYISAIASSTYLHQTSFFRYCFQQFPRIAQSIYIQNSAWIDEKDNAENNIAFKHMITESVLQIAEDLSTRSFGNTNTRGSGDEGTGEEEFFLCKKWHDSKNPLFLCNHDEGDKNSEATFSLLISDIEIIIELLDFFKQLGFLLFDWNDDLQKREEAVEHMTENIESDQNEKRERAELLFRVLGVPLALRESIGKELCAGEFAHYVLTFDNILKMVAIAQQIRSNTPVILMGETGCGKTSLIKCLAKVANVKLEAVDVHGGLTRADIRLIVRNCIERFKTQDLKEMWIFFDETNTSPDLGWFKELICNHTIDGINIPKEIKIIGACNPYRRRRFDGHVKDSFSKDPLSQYVYRVFPLPETMKEYVWQFGRLSNLDEKQYILEMTKKTIAELYPKKPQKWSSSIPFIVKKISISQKCLRKNLQDKAIVSLRDVARCLSTYSWLRRRYSKTHAVPHWSEKCLVIALGLCYYFKLNKKEREEYNKMISGNRGTPFDQQLQKEIDTLCNCFEIPSGVARNQALKENLFVLFLCIITTTPLILVGKPGTSKTLSYQIIRNNLSHSGIKNFEAKLEENKLPLKVKPIHPITFQCTHDSKPEGIKERWEQAMRHSENPQIVPLLLLDKIDLAEHSKHNPLKVLHQLLEHPKISFVGISNWRLDAAKMNRVVVHQIQPMNTVELMETAKEMLEHHKKIYETNNCVAFDNHILRKEIENIAQVYDKVICDKSGAFRPGGKKHFFGAHDFYSLIRYQLNSQLLMQSFEGFMRNFGGIPGSKLQEHLGAILETVLGMKKSEISNKMSKWTPLECVRKNLRDNSPLLGDNYMISRHCMIISELEHSWQVLLDQDVLKYDNEFLFGSCFPADRLTTITNYNHLNKIISCMEGGKTVVMYNLENIHESLYDMLNQRYQKKPSGKPYCRVALGSESRDCYVSEKFKLVVIVTKSVAYSPEMPIAFLNRFEKQLISYESSLQPEVRAHIQEMRDKLSQEFGMKGGQLSELFPGFCDDTIPSALSCILAEEQHDKKHEEQKVGQVDIETETETETFNFKEIERKILQLFRPMCRPEKLIELAIQKKYRPSDDPAQPEHFPTLVLFFKKIISLYDLYILQILCMQQKMIVDERHDKFAEQMLMVLTLDFECNLGKEWHADLLKVEDYNKASDFEKAVESFFNPNSNKNRLLLQYRYEPQNLTQFIQIKHILQKTHHRYLKSENKELRKTVVCIIHIGKGVVDGSFPLIFSRKWKYVYMDYLSCTEPISLKTLLTQRVTNVINNEPIPNIRNNIRRALGHLRFPACVDVYKELERVSLLFKDNVFEELQAVIKQRLLS